MNDNLLSQIEEEKSNDVSEEMKEDERFMTVEE
jgi:hypothetical protein